MRFFNKLFQICALVIFSGLLVFAQSGSAKGKVRSPKGDGIGGATIIARQEGEDIKTVKTDNKGNFEMKSLKAGVYNFVFEKDGYGSGILYNVEIKNDKTRNLGDRLILTIDQGTLVLIKGSVFDQDGRSLGGAKVEIERILSDGSTKKVGSGYTSYSGEFTFKFAEGASKFRVTASAKGIKDSKEIEVNSAAIYRLALTLDLSKEK